MCTALGFTFCATAVQVTAVQVTAVQVTVVQVTVVQVTVAKKPLLVWRLSGTVDFSSQ